MRPQSIVGSTRRIMADLNKKVPRSRSSHKWLDSSQLNCNFYNTYNHGLESTASTFIFGKVCTWQCSFFSHLRVDEPNHFLCFSARWSLLWGLAQFHLDRSRWNTSSYLAGLGVREFFWRCSATVPSQFFLLFHAKTPTADIHALPSSIVAHQKAGFCRLYYAKSRKLDRWSGAANQASQFGAARTSLGEQVWPGILRALRRLLSVDRGFCELWKELPIVAQGFTELWKELLICCLSFLFERHDFDQLTWTSGNDMEIRCNMQDRPRWHDSACRHGYASGTFNMAEVHCFSVRLRAHLGALKKFCCSICL